MQQIKIKYYMLFNRAATEATVKLYNTSTFSHPILNFTLMLSSLVAANFILSLHRKS